MFAPAVNVEPRQSLSAQLQVPESLLSAAQRPLPLGFAVAQLTKSLAEPSTQLQAWLAFFCAEKSAHGPPQLHSEASGCATGSQA